MGGRPLYDGRDDRERVEDVVQRLQAGSRLHGEGVRQAMGRESQSRVPFGRQGEMTNFIDWKCPRCWWHVRLKDETVQADGEHEGKSLVEEDIDRQFAEHMKTHRGH